MSYRKKMKVGSILPQAMTCSSLTTRKTSWQEAAQLECLSCWSVSKSMSQRRFSPLPFVDFPHSCTPPSLFPLNIQCRWMRWWTRLDRFWMSEDTQATPRGMKVWRQNRSLRLIDPISRHSKNHIKGMLLFLDHFFITWLSHAHWKGARIKNDRDRLMG